jgi:3-oxoacyl-[acyl-carrier protein] reductase
MPIARPARTRSWLGFTRRAGRPWLSRGHVSKPEEIQRLFSEIKKAFGRVDVLVNNAGMYEFAPLEAITPEHIEKHLNLNVAGLLLTTKEAVKFNGAGWRLHR